MECMRVISIVIDHLPPPAWGCMRVAAEAEGKVTVGRPLLLRYYYAAPKFLTPTLD